jgi:hypothetical protein
MASADVIISEQPAPLVNPWPWLVGGLTATALAALWALIGQGAVPPARAILVFAGVVASAGAVAIRPASSRVLAGAACAAFLGCWGLYVRDDPAAWDSLRLFLAVAFAVALAAALLVLLPRVWRRVVISLFIVLHFGGIVSACLSTHQWLASWVYVYVYRNYLEFMYLTNAYHFYAPEPGPAYLLWFRIEYTKGQDKGTTYWHWHKVPDLDENGWPQYALDLQYQRRISLAGLAAQAVQPLDPQRAPQIALRHEKENLARMRAGRLIIPRYPDMQIAEYQYAEPANFVKLVISSYVRHVAYKFQKAHPEATIRNIKVYRIIHFFLTPSDFSHGKDPCDPTTYTPYFWGKFNVDGQLVDDQDPFLYWHLPFLKVNPDQSPHFVPNSEFPGKQQSQAFQQSDDQFRLSVHNATHLRNEKHFKVFSYMHLHAGDSKWVLHSGDRQWKEQ